MTKENWLLLIHPMRAGNWNFISMKKKSKPLEHCTLSSMSALYFCGARSADVWVTVHGKEPTRRVTCKYYSNIKEESVGHWPIRENQTDVNVSINLITSKISFMYSINGRHHQVLLGGFFIKYKAGNHTERQLLKKGLSKVVSNEGVVRIFHAFGQTVFW